MKLNLSPRQSRLFALGLFGLAVVFFASVLVVPLWSTYEQNKQEIEQQRQSLLRFKRLAADRSALEQELHALEARGDMQRYLLQGGSGTLAAAALQERVKEIVARSDGRLISTQMLPPAPENSFDRVTISVRMQVYTEGLQRVLYDLEKGSPLLSVDELTVLSRRIGGRQRRFLAQPNLDVRFSLSGFIPAATQRKGQ